MIRRFHGIDRHKPFSGRADALSVLEDVELSEATRAVFETELALLAKVMEAKEELGEKIVVTSEPRADQVARSCPELERQYAELVDRRGTGRDRIAMTGGSVGS